MYIEPKPAIYKLENENTGDFYVGGTRNAQARKRNHYYDFRKGRHRNPKMQIDFNNGAKFSFSILEYLSGNPSDDTIVRREQEWLQFLNPTYNTKNAVAIFGSDIFLQKERKMAGHSGRIQTQAEKTKRAKSVKEYWNTHPPKKMPIEFVERLKARITGKGHPNWGKVTPQNVKEQISATLAKTYYFVDPSGKEVIIVNMKKFCQETKLWGLSKLTNGQKKSYRGWTFIKSEKVK